MTLETKVDLDEPTIKAVQNLGQANVDSSQGFTEAAEEVKDAGLSALFTEMGKQRRQLADTLQQHVQVNAERPRAEGTGLASLHRTWLELRSKLNGGDARVILCEAERGEDHIKHAYENVLKQMAGRAVNDFKPISMWS